jgi:ABC-type dipeptide/oligopeptide/nickel transport system permease subunit
MTTPQEIAEATPRVSEWRRFVRVFFNRPVVVFGFIVILAFVIMAIFAPLLAPYDPYETSPYESLMQPCWEHPLGTDLNGRDTLSRLIYGSQTSLIIGIVTVSVGAIVGMTIGLVAGYFGGWVNAISMRAMDTLMAFPMILLALAIAAILGGGLKNIIFALSIASLPINARVMHGQVLSVNETDYIMAGHAMGASSKRIMLRHIVPNCFPPLIVLMTMSIGMIILAEAGLSFLGIGIEPPTAAWGAMVNEGYIFLLTNPVLSFAPGIAIMLVVLAFNMVGDGLRDALDPKLRGII